MFSNRPFFLHTLFLPVAAQNISLSSEEDFAAVAGVPFGYSPQSVSLPYFATRPEYLIPLGAAGLPYVGDLGRPGGEVVLSFPGAVRAVVVASYSALRPNVQVGSVPTMTSVAVSDMYPENSDFFIGGVVDLDNGTSVHLRFPAPENGNAFRKVFSYGAPFLGVAAYPGYTLF